MIATSRHEHALIAVAKITRLRQQSLTPAQYLEKAFHICRSAFENHGAAYWKLSSSGSATLLAHVPASELSETNPKTLESEIAPHLRTVCLTRRVAHTPVQQPTSPPVIDQTAPRPESDSLQLLLLPICMADTVKAVISFWIETSEPFSDSHLSALQQLANTLDNGLEDAFERSKVHSNQQRWTRVLPNAPTATAGAPAPSKTVPTNRQVPRRRTSDTKTRSSKPRRVGGQREQSPSRHGPLLQLAKVVGRGLKMDTVAYNVVNELKSYFGAGRFGLALVRGTRCPIVALSSIETLDTRSPVVIALQNLCQLAARSGTSWWIPEQNDTLNTEMTLAVNEYFEATEASSIALLPIYADGEYQPERDNLASAIVDPNERRGSLIAILSVEGLSQEIRRSELSEAWRAAEPVVANALHNARQFSAIPLLPLWLAAGNFVGLYVGHHRQRAILISGLLLVTMAILGFFPTDLKVRSQGIVQPTIRGRIYAEVPGTVASVHVADGSMVSAGTPLLELTNPDIELEFQKIQGEYRETQQGLVGIQDQLNSSSDATDAVSRGLRKERVALEERLQSLEKQMSLVAIKRSRLNIVSPHAGRVITWDLSQRLGRRPVEPGQHLLTIADDSGPWELELQVPDKLTGYLQRAIAARKDGQPLLVEFVLASDPTQKRFASVRHIAETTNPDDKAGSVLRVYADLQANASDHNAWLPTVKPGTEVVAHIHAGKYSLGYALSYEFLDWLHRTCFKYLG